MIFVAVDPSTISCFKFATIVETAPWAKMSVRSIVELDLEICCCWVLLEKKASSRTNSMTTKARTMINAAPRSEE